MKDFSKSLESDPYLVVGHRGCPVRHPDNSMEGIAAGLRAVGMVEVDVRRTRDDVLVLSHDPDLFGKVVSEHVYSELAGEGAGPVRLSSTLERFPDGAFDLEVKNDPAEPGFDESREVAVRTARSARPRDLVTSFDWPSVDLVAERMSRIPTGLLLDGSRDLAEAVRHAVEYGHLAVLPRWTDLDDAGLRTAREARVHVLTWTLDDPLVARELVARGVRGIITNDPESIRDALEEGVA